MLAVVAAVVVAADGGGDPEPAAEQVEAAPEETGTGRPAAENGRAGEDSHPGPDELSAEPEPRPGAEPRPEAGERERAAGILSSRNPLKQAKRAGYEVLRATPGGADEVYEILGEEAGTFEKLLGGGG